MGLFGSDQTDERVQDIVESAIHDSVTAEKVGKKKSSGLTAHNYLNDKPLVEYLQKDEQPHFLWAIVDSWGIENPPVEVNEGQDLVPNGKLRVMVALTDERLLFVVGNKEGDKEVTVPYSEIGDIQIGTGSGTKEFPILSVITSDINYNIRGGISGDERLQDFEQAGEFVSAMGDDIDYQSDKADESQSRSTPDRSAKKIAKEAEGNIKSKHLTKDSGMASTYLYDGPLVTHLENGEQPEYILSCRNLGYRITEPNGNEKTPHHNEGEGKKYLLATDQRVLYVAGREDGDESIEHNYSQITDVKAVGAGNLQFLTDSGTEYKFAAGGTATSEVNEVVDYIKSQSGLEDDEPKDMTGASEPDITTRGKKVRVSGNSNEKTNCGRVEVYSDKIKIQQKGRLMSKGWVTVNFDDIVDVQMSSLGKLKLRTNRQDVAVTGVGGPAGTKILKHMRDYLENKKNEIERKNAKMEDRVENAQNTGSSADEIAKFAKLKEEGIISEEEFQEKKDELL